MMQTRYEPVPRQETPRPQPAHSRPTVERTRPGVTVVVSVIKDVDDEEKEPGYGHGV